MVNKEQIQRYYQYGVAKNEEELEDLWRLTMDVSNSLWPCEEINEVQMDMFHRFTTGFLEGCLFQNVLIILRLLQSGYRKEDVATFMDVPIEIVEEITSKQ